MRCAIRDLEFEASCLSWVRRESHAQFFGEGVVAISPPYPTNYRSLQRCLRRQIGRDGFQHVRREIAVR